MIKDNSRLEEIRKEWHTVRLSQAKIKTNLNAASFSLTGSAITGTFRDLCYSLLLPFAYSVLEHTFQQLKEEGSFSCESNRFNKLMKGSKSALSWKDYDLVYEGMKRRNEFAHEQKTIPRKDTWKYIDAIENELITWKILPGPVECDYTITTGRMTSP